MRFRRLLLATLMAAAVTGCASTVLPVPAPPAATPPAATPTAPAVTLPWPDGDLAALQESVDDGSQPWLLDPAEVSLAYAAAAHGWSTVQVVASSDGATADVTGPQSQRRTLTLQRPGPDGIWLVLSDTPTP